MSSDSLQEISKCGEDNSSPDPKDKVEEDLLFPDLVAETAACEDVQRMAETFAPQLTELQDVLKDISADESDLSALELAETAARSLQEEDDDMDDELKQLAMSEQALREELEFAQDMNTVLTGPVTPSHSGDDPPEEKFDPPTPIPMKPLPSQTPPRPKPKSKVEPPAHVSPKGYSLQDHANFLHLKTEKSGGWYFSDTTQHLLAQTMSGNDSEGVIGDLVKDYCLPIPYRKLKRLYSGLMYHNVSVKQTAATSNDTTFSSSTPRQEDGSRLDPAASSEASVPTIHSATLSAQTQEEPLPVRTIAIRLRPDVLCGAIMDAIHHAFQVSGNGSTTMHVLKRQGGHLRGAVYSNQSKQTLAYVVDAQVCTQKNDELERRLVLRFYHIQDDPDAMHELGQVLQQKKQVPIPPSPGLVDEGIISNDSGSDGNRHLKQSCSLIQRLMAAQQQQSMDPKQQASWLGLRSNSMFKSKAAMQRCVGKHLESNFKSCPSVRAENKKASPTIRRLTLPSLSNKDWPILDVSWTLTSSILEELDTRDCSFNTFTTLPFGQFPSLPTLDVHFCSQLRRLSRENMITHLLKSAKDLEEYAKSAEYNCAVCISLLKPMLMNYELGALELPKPPKSLQEYPLEFTPPQVACPPWGGLVMEALNQVAARTPTGEISETKAIQQVYDAFCKQDDEEQAARLGRKNAQIMERLATMQRHQKGLIDHIRDSYVYSPNAGRAADKFLRRLQLATNVGKPGSPSLLREEVPLLSCRISLGASSSGTCYITATQILFTTTFIPLVGATTTNCFDLNLVDFEVDESAAATLLNPFPNTMTVILKSGREKLFTFRPAVGPRRLHKFLQVIQSFCGEGRASEYSRVDVDVVEEDGVLRLTDTVSEDQLSI